MRALFHDDLDMTMSGNITVPDLDVAVVSYPFVVSSNMSAHVA